MKKIKKLTKKQIAANVARYNKAEEKRSAERTKWEELVKNHKATMYMKPTRYRHSSGFRIFEVGYCEVDNGKVTKKFVHGMCSDHIHSDYGALIGYGKAPMLNMDLTLDGYIRMWGNEKQTILWEEWALSSVAITTLEMREHRLKEREKRGV